MMLLIIDSLLSIALVPAKVTDIKLNETLGDKVYTIVELDASEIVQDESNNLLFNLIINYDSSYAITMVPCNNKDLAECQKTNNTQIVNNKTAAFVQKQAITQYSLSPTVSTLYIHIIGSTYINQSVKLQSFFAIHVSNKKFNISLKQQKNYLYSYSCERNTKLQISKQVKYAINKEEFQQISQNSGQLIDINDSDSMLMTNFITIFGENQGVLEFEEINSYQELQLETGALAKLVEFPHCTAYFHTTISDNSTKSTLTAGIIKEKVSMFFHTIDSAKNEITTDKSVIEIRNGSYILQISTKNDYIRMPWVSNQQTRSEILLLASISYESLNYDINSTIKQNAQIIQNSQYIYPEQFNINSKHQIAITSNEPFSAPKLPGLIGPEAEYQENYKLYQLSLDDAQVIFCQFKNTSEKYVLATPLNYIQTQIMINDQFDLNQYKYYKINSHSQFVNLIITQQIITNIQVYASNSFITPNINNNEAKFSCYESYCKFTLPNQPNQLYFSIKSNNATKMQFLVQESDYDYEFLNFEQKNSIELTHNTNLAVKIANFTDEQEQNVIKNIAKYESMIYQVQTVEQLENCEIQFYNYDETELLGTLNNQTKYLNFNHIINEFHVSKDGYQVTTAKLVNCNSTQNIVVQTVPVFEMQNIKLWKPNIKTLVFKTQFSHLIDYYFNYTMEYATDIFVCSYAILDNNSSCGVIFSYENASDIQLFVDSVNKQIIDQTNNNTKNISQLMNGIVYITVKSNQGYTQPELKMKSILRIVTTTEKSVRNKQDFDLQLLDTSDHIAIEVKEITGTICIGFKVGECATPVLDKGLQYFQVNSQKMLFIDVQQSATFKMVQLQSLNKTTQYKRNGSQFFVYQRKNLQSTLLVTASPYVKQYTQQVQKQHLQQNLRLYASDQTKSIPSLSNTSHSSQYDGTQLVQIIDNSTLDVVIYVNYLGSYILGVYEQDQLLQVNFSQTKHVVNKNAVLLLQQSYSPGGVIVEQCYKEGLHINASWLNVPNEGIQSTVEVNNLVKSNIFKIIYNIEEFKSFFFLRLNNTNDVIVENTLYNEHNLLKNAKIYVTKSDKEKITIKFNLPVHVTNEYSVQIHNLTQDMDFSIQTTCGISNYPAIEKLVVNEQNIIDGYILYDILVQQDMKINAILFKNQLLNGIAYYNRELQKGVKVDKDIENQYKKDLSWIIYVAIALIAATSIIVGVVYACKHKGYTKLLDESKSNNPKRQMKGLEDDMDDQ